MKVKTFLKKACRVRMDYFHKTHYHSYYKNSSINGKEILLESQRGNNLNGNIYYLLRELSNNIEYKDYSFLVVYKKGKKREFISLLKKSQISNIKLIRLCSRKYYKACARAKYLINDTSFLPFFIKKEGQVILNTWHGTPLKTIKVHIHPQELFGYMLSLLRISIIRILFFLIISFFRMIICVNI